MVGLGWGLVDGAGVKEIIFQQSSKESELGWEVCEEPLAIFAP